MRIRRAAAWGATMALLVMAGAACTPEDEAYAGVLISESGEVQVVAALCDGDALKRVYVVERETEDSWRIESSADGTGLGDDEVLRTSVFSLPDDWTTVFSDLDTLEAGQTYVAGFDSEEHGANVKPISFDLEQLPDDPDLVLYEGADGPATVTVADFAETSNC